MKLQIDNFWHANETKYIREMQNTSGTLRVKWYSTAHARPASKQIYIPYMHCQFDLCTYSWPNNTISQISPMHVPYTKTTRGTVDVNSGRRNSNCSPALHRPFSIDRYAQRPARLESYAIQGGCHFTAAGSHFTNRRASQLYIMYCWISGR